MNTAKRRFSGRITRGLMAFMTVFGLTAGIGVVGATSAAADTGNYVLYRVYPADVCSHQGNFGVLTPNPLNPYVMRCYDLAFPVGFSIAGELKIQDFCDWKWPGSVAVVEEQNFLGWRCKRAEKP